MIVEILGDIVKQPLFIIVAAVFVTKMIDIVILKTISKKDDLIWGKIKSIAGQAYHAVELIEKSGGLKILLKNHKTNEKKVAKYKSAIDTFRKKYYIDTGKIPRVSVLNYAAEEFTRLAIKDKALKEIIITAVKENLKKKASKKK